MENKFKANREFTSRSIWSDWREQLKESEINGLLQRLEVMDRGYSLIGYNGITQKATTLTVNVWKIM
ncbi:hypothetical protein KUH03_05190 [Sphingobacterium sp. E70]|uniref:hypothetical protein n=1 Tax=Sphingobacterium sp. E70 TaxID=2853439 RepID=UPI00211B8D27|nr:hypothetical protein [Sphingobacterium sp. E70]ULT26311.1 hypothetical protein KUH03_05190 [Sphingobacterium sp. E70]